MYCENCGKELRERSNFCSNCGSEVLKKEREKKNYRFQGGHIAKFEPVFNLVNIYIPLLPKHIFFTLWAGGFFGGFGSTILTSLGYPLKLKVSFIFFGLLAFLGIPIVVLFRTMKTYENTQYILYDDRLEYTEGFWTAEKKIIKYKNITEANLKIGVLQKRLGLGTIILSTPATGGSIKSGIFIRDIQNPQEVYSKISNVLKNS